MAFRRPLACLAIAVLVALTTSTDPAAAEDLTYQLPPQVLVDFVDAPLTPGVSISPTKEWMLLMARPSLPPISELAEPELRLAGLRLKPRTNGPSRGGYVTGLTLKRVDDLSERPITGLPADARISGVRWSPDGSRIAFVLTGQTDITLWTAAVADGKAKQLTKRPLNTAFGFTSAWLPDSRTLVCLAVPVNRGPEPAADLTPKGPVVDENLGKTAPARTYQDLLKDPRDEALFEHYVAAQPLRVTVDGKTQEIGAPALITGIEPSPDGRFLLVTSVHRPFSYRVPFYYFPERSEVWDLDGKLVKLVADTPLQEGVPITYDSVPIGPRSMTWRDDMPATLIWAEAQDGGDAAVEAAVRDHVLTLAAPFQGEPQLLFPLGYRYAGADWTTDGRALISERWWKTRRLRTWLVNGNAPEDPAQLTPVWDRSSEDRYADPGDPMLAPDARGRMLIVATPDGRSVFLSGQGASEEGNRPFLDRFSLDTREAQRLWRSEAPYYESVIGLLDDSGQRVLTSRESREAPANFFIRDLADGSLKQLTAFPHPTPQLLGMTKELIHYTRADGVKLTANLYLPPGYKKEQGPLPVLMWAYPQEFKSADAAGQVTDSPYRFDRVSGMSSLVWLTRGYAVLDDPSMPIVGEGDKEPNDTYVQQLVASAQAAADEVARLGVGDPNRLAVGGHSYGAFMTANLLAYSDIFRAGLARSGAYNRTLTPFGFQSEERTLWQAPEVYAVMSPFNHADTIDEPILLSHGQADNNSGTFPIQSERLFDALKGLGKTARLVMLPSEAHGYRARESVLHILWESDRWLEQYVKNAPPRGAKGDTSPK